MTTRSLRENAGCFAGALTATVLIVLIDYLPPLLLAETVDSVLGANPSSPPGWMLSPLRGLGLSRDWLRANLWALGLTLVLIYKKFGSTRTRFFIASGCGVMAAALVTTLFVFGNVLPQFFGDERHEGMNDVQELIEDVERGSKGPGINGCLVCWFYHLEVPTAEFVGEKLEDRHQRLVQTVLAV